MMGLMTCPQVAHDFYLCSSYALVANYLPCSCRHSARNGTRILHHVLLAKDLMLFEGLDEWQITTTTSPQAVEEPEVGRKSSHLARAAGRGLWTERPKIPRTTAAPAASLLTHAYSNCYEC
jgi:hypothetical protein